MLPSSHAATSDGKTQAQVDDHGDQRHGMHELSLAEALITAIEAAARRECFTRVRVARLEIGALSCVEPHALRLAFEVASVGSVAEGATLVLLTVDGWGRCRGCGEESAMHEFHDLCPRCDAASLEPLRGTDLRIITLDVD
jgi:hydrogenase nickel incorporation protein HypA/HybF